MDIRRLSVDTDLCVHSLEQAFRLIVPDYETPETIVLTVHPFAKQLAEYFVWHSGYRFPVVVDDTIVDENSWYLATPTQQVHGA